MHTTITYPFYLRTAVKGKRVEGAEAEKADRRVATRHRSGGRTTAHPSVRSILIVLSLFMYHQSASLTGHNFICFATMELFIQDDLQTHPPYTRTVFIIPVGNIRSFSMTRLERRLQAARRSDCVQRQAVGSNIYIIHTCIFSHNLFDVVSSRLLVPSSNSSTCPLSRLVNFQVALVFNWAHRDQENNLWVDYPVASVVHVWSHGHARHPYNCVSNTARNLGPG